MLRCEKKTLRETNLYGRKMSIQNVEWERSVQELFRGGTLQELVLVYVGAFLVILVKIVSSCMQAVDRALRRQVTGVGEDDAEEFVDADLGNVSWRIMQFIEAG
jgi:hypothetical protein